MKKEKNYNDIIDLPHPEPKTRARMPRRDRAAQFSPFAALTGFEELIAQVDEEESKQKDE